MIRRLRLKNFRRYEDEVFEFPTGATFIEGENNAGKTSILYAIEYALFGNVAQFKSPGTLLRPKTKAGGVEMDFEGIDGKLYRLQRIHAKPPRARTKVTGHYTLIELLQDEPQEDAQDQMEEPTSSESRNTDDEEPKTTEPSGRYVLSSDFQDHEEKLALKIAELLGISKRMFELAISTRQSETARILAGSPKLDIVLGITAVALAEEEFRSMALQREKQCKSLPIVEEALKRTEEELENAQTRAANLEKEREGLADQRKELTEQQRVNFEASTKMAELQTAIDELNQLNEESQTVIFAQTSLDDQQRDFLEEHGDSANIQKEQTRTEAVLKRTESQAQQETETAQKLRANLRALDAQVGDLAGRIERRSQLDTAATACETCGQPIDPERAQLELAEWQSEHKKLSLQQEDLQKQIERAEATLETARVEAQQHKERSAELQRLLQEVQSMRTRQESLAKQAEEATPAIAATWNATLNLAQQFQMISDALELGFSFDAPTESDVATDPKRVAERTTKLHDATSKVATAIEVKAAQITAELDSNETLEARQEADQNELKDAQATLARESAKLQQELESLQAAQDQAATLRLCSKAFQELQEKLREQAAEALATNTLALHQELSHSDEFTKLTIDPSNYAVQVKARDYDQFAPAAVFQGGGHRVLLGLAFKLAVAQMVGHCPFLLLDEPTDGLDEEHRRQLMERLGSVSVTRQMLVITHEGTEQENGHRIRIQRKNKKTSIQV